MSDRHAVISTSIKVALFKMGDAEIGVNYVYSRTVDKLLVILPMKKWSYYFDINQLLRKRND